MIATLKKLAIDFDYSTIETLALAEMFQEIQYLYQQLQQLSF
jgi:hypothetical protein